MIKYGELIYKLKNLKKQKNMEELIKGKIFKTEIKGGDTLICINSGALPGNDNKPELEYEREYLCNTTYTCECGQEHILIGLVSSLNFVSCYNCGDNLKNSDKIHYCHPSRFVIKK